VCGKVIDLEKELTHGLHCKQILLPLFHQYHSDMYHTVASFIKYAHKDCVIGTEVEIVRDAAQGPSVVITEPDVAHTVHVPDSSVCVSISSFRKSLVQCPIISM